MPELATQLESLDGLPESIDPRTLFTEQDGKFLLTGVAGLKTQADIERIQGALVNERNEHKSTKDKFAALGDADPVELLAKLDRMKELEVAAAGNKDEMDAKLEELTEARITSRLAPVERERQTLAEQLEQYKSAVEELTAKDHQRQVLDKVRAAAAESKVQTASLPDAELLAQSVFAVGEDGSILTKENPFGVSPGLDPSAFFIEMQSKNRPWWELSQGGGSNGNVNGGGGGNNPFSAEHWNMTEQGKVLQANPERAKQLAAAAGTTVGGRKPVAKT